MNTSCEYHLNKLSGPTLRCLLSTFVFAAAGACLAQTPGTKLWTVTAPQQIISSPAIASDGTIYVGSGDPFGSAPGTLCSFSPQGTTNWYLPFPRALASSPSIGPDGRIYVGCLNGDCGPSLGHYAGDMYHVVSRGEHGIQQDTPASRQEFERRPGEAATGGDGPGGDRSHVKSQAGLALQQTNQGR
jgi:outer membrane protein assembly factor BamB